MLVRIGPISNNNLIKIIYLEKEAIQKIVYFHVQSLFIFVEYQHHQFSYIQLHYEVNWKEKRASGYIFFLFYTCNAGIVWMKLFSIFVYFFLRKNFSIFWYKFLSEFNIYSIQLHRKFTPLILVDMCLQLHIVRNIYLKEYTLFEAKIFI